MKNRDRGSSRSREVSTGLLPPRYEKISRRVLLNFQVRSVVVSRYSAFRLLGYDFYNNHPDHVDFVQKRWIPEVANFLEIDYERLNQA